MRCAGKGREKSCLALSCDKLDASTCESLTCIPNMATHARTGSESRNRLVREQVLCHQQGEASMRPGTCSAQVLSTPKFPSRAARAARHPVAGSRSRTERAHVATECIRCVCLPLCKGLAFAFRLRRRSVMALLPTQTGRHSLLILYCCHLSELRGTQDCADLQDVGFRAASTSPTRFCWISFQLCRWRHFHLRTILLRAALDPRHIAAICPQLGLQAVVPLGVAERVPAHSTLREIFACVMHPGGRMVSLISNP